MKGIKVLLSIFLVITLMTGCSTKAFDADTSTVLVQKNGKVVSVTVEAFDKSYYNKDELKSLIDENVSKYNADHEKAVTVKKYETENNVAKLIINYNTATDYANFNNLTFFAGTVSEAIREGYEFDTEFLNVEDGSATTTEAVKSLTDYKVIIFEEPIHVETSGKVSYMSSNLKQEGKKSVSRAEDVQGLSYVIYE